MSLLGANLIGSIIARTVQQKVSESDGSELRSRATKLAFYTIKIAAIHLVITPFPVGATA